MKRLGVVHAGVAVIGAISMATAIPAVAFKQGKTLREAFWVELNGGLISEAALLQNLSKK